MEPPARFHYHPAPIFLDRIVKEDDRGIAQVNIAAGGFKWSWLRRIRGAESRAAV
jgi:hypothetical protein